MADAVGVGLEVESRAEDIPSAAWRLLELIAGLLIGAITVLVTVQVFARYVLNNTPPWSEELCRYLFVWVSFLGACVATRRAAHLGVDSLVSRLPAGAREVLRHAVTALIVVFAGLLVWQGAALVPAMASQRSPSMGISLQYVFVAIPIAGVIILGCSSARWPGPGARPVCGPAWRSRWPPRSRSCSPGGWSRCPPRWRCSR